MEPRIIFYWHIKAFDEHDRSIFLDDSKHLRAYLKHGSSKNTASIIKEKNEN